MRTYASACCCWGEESGRLSTSSKWRAGEQPRLWRRMVKRSGSDSRGGKTLGCFGVAMAVR